METISPYYIEGIKEGRALLKEHGIGYAQEALNNLQLVARLFDAQSATGQMIRGERDFWANQLKRAKA